MSRLMRMAIVSGTSLATTMATLSGSAGAQADSAGIRAGREFADTQCAQCHGVDGTGSGPMAKILTVHPADLTAISKQASGKFPADRIVEIIRYGGNIQGHGDQVMPIWGKVFSSEGGGGKGGEVYSRRAVVELKNYLEKIQQK